MLLQFRNITRGWVATIIVALIGLATVLFLIPNSGLQLTGNNWLAQIAGRQITAPQLTRELELMLRAERSQGNNVSKQDAIDAGLHLRLLDSMIGRNALYAFAERVGVSAGDAQVANRIREIPAVRNAVTGAFDQNAYNAFLQQLSYSQAEFEADVRNDLTTQMFMEALLTGIRAPSSFGALAYAYDNETRVVSIAEATAAATGAIPQPTQEQLQAFWEDNQEQLRVPEFRGITLVYARPSDFVARVIVPEARLREEFDARAAALTQPERRSYVRIVARNEAQANEIAARLNRGESADAVAAALSLQATRGENQAQREVPDSAVAEAIFAAPVRGQARVARGDLSPWVVVKVEGSTPEVRPDFAAYREELRNAIATDEAADLLNAAVSAFEDTRAGGASIADAARRHGLPVVVIQAVELGGRDQQGRVLEALAGHEDVLELVFETPEGEATDFIPVGDTDVMASVDRIIPPSVRPLDEVRQELTQAWISRERARKLRELGEQIVEAVRGGQSLAQAARAHRASVVVASRQMDRAAASQIPARGLAGQIFAAAEGAVVSDTAANGNAVFVAVIERINRAEPADAPQAVEANRAQLQTNIGQSVGEALQAEIVDRARPRRNETLISRTYRSSSENAEEGQ
jgi:peptidyl-prolyl cis-trans isomerase D